MFDLDRAVDDWSREFAGAACGRGDRVEELKDHLFCEIEDNMREGLNEESAFLAAIRRFGISEELKREFSKGKSIESMLCELEEGLRALDHNPKKTAVYTGIWLVLYAALTFTLAVYLRDGMFQWATPVLFVMMFLLLLFVSSLRKNSQAECAYMKRLWRKVF